MTVTRLRRCAVVVLLAALCSPAAASAARTPRIVGGVPASTTDLPYVAGLMIALQGVGGDGPDALCAGSLIAARWVLTAGHCLAPDPQPIDPAGSSAILGATNLEAATSAQRYRFAETFVAPGYANGNGGDDVGLVRLARPAPQAQLRLLRPSDAALFAPDTTALTAGWGFTEDPDDGGSLSTDQLRAVDLRIYSDPECQQAFLAAGEGGALDFATEICALAPNKDSCNGDSGGPLIVQDGGGLPALAGAVSFGIGSGNILRGSRSCNEGPPGVYSRLGSDSLNAFVRRHVPQVELDHGPAAAAPGQKLTFTATPSAPEGSGPFGGYDTLSWDLDGDGSFGEREGDRQVRVTAARGATTVSVRATTADDDAEIRTERVPSLDKSAVSFARKRFRARRGKPVRLRVRRVGVGGGSVKVRLGRRARTVSFSGEEGARTVRFRARRRARRARTVRAKLTRFSGEVVAGARTRARVRIAPRHR